MLARQGRLEAAIAHVLVINIEGLFNLEVAVLEEPRQSQRRGGKAGAD